MPFDEQFLLEGRHTIDIDIKNRLAQVDAENGLFERPQDLAFSPLCQAWQKLVPRQVSGQTDPRGYDNVGPGTGALKPLADSVG